MFSDVRAAVRGAACRLDAASDVDRRTAGYPRYKLGLGRVGLWKLTAWSWNLPGDLQGANMVWPVLEWYVWMYEASGSPKQHSSEFAECYSIVFVTVDVSTDSILNLFMVMEFRRLLFISTKTSMFSCFMFSCNMLAVIQDLMSMTRYWMLLIIWCYDSILFGLKAMYSYVIGIWKFHWYYRAIAPSGLYTGWRMFGQVVIPGALRKTDFDMMTVNNWYNNGLSPLSTIGSEPVQWGTSDTHIMQSKQQYTRVYDIKCIR